MKREERKRLNSIGPYVVCVVFLLVAGLTLAWQHVKALSIGYRINELKQEKNEMEHQRRLLLLEKASLIDYEHIENKAKKKHRFIEPELGQELVYHIESGQLIMMIPRDKENDQSKHK
ncbi:hypothetical protein ACFL27_07575 [candidate division CSSED10-310 bacterium]|uniref:Septum formation initiator family protein n=1 Tax=candidate division CSSED10-310 bacterium TaxID=2855610 RepID=A0ABV6YV38_UNCC1